MQDEGRLIPPIEARARKTLRKKAKAEIPRIKHVEKIVGESGDVHHRMLITTPKSTVRLSAERPPKSDRLHVTSMFPDRQTIDKYAKKTTMYPTGTMSWKDHDRIHRTVKNELLSFKDVKELLGKVGRMFPTVKVVEGYRVSGAKAEKGFRNQGVRMGLQKMKIPKSSKAGKAVKLGESAYKALQRLQKD